METKKLLQFKVLVECGGLRRASELLNISAGGLSKSIHSLEEELGFALFSEKGRGLEITEAGLNVYEKIPRLLEQLDNLKDVPSIANSAKLKIATFEVFSTHFLSRAVREFFPTREVSIHEAIPGEMEKLVADKRADYAITYAPIPHKNLEFLKITKIAMGIYGKAKFKTTTFTELPFVIPTSPIVGSPTGIKGLDGWPEHLKTRKVQYQVEMMETALGLCQEGMAVAFLPEFVVALYNEGRKVDSQLIALAYPKDLFLVERDVYLIQRTKQEESGTSKKARQSHPYSLPLQITNSGDMFSL